MPHSDSDLGTEAGRSTFDRLSPPVRRWVWVQGWRHLRDVQEKAIPPILAGGDVVVSARTAAGKTEAAFLPLLSRIPAERDAGFSVVYVSPIKALINDQARRLESLVEACGLPLHRWHGDVSADAKRKARDRPYGVVLITPESLEATLVRRGTDVPRLFGTLDAIVIDELHAFIGSERGVQLQSILSRIELACGRPSIDRIGLSATLGDMALAAEALRPGGGGSVAVIEGKDPGNGLKMQVRGYVHPTRGPEPPALKATDEGGRPDEDKDEAVRPVVHEAIVADLSRTLRGRSNLLFAGSRRNVEVYADALRHACESTGLPNEFFPHHGNLSKAEREDVERRLRDDPRPTTAVATTTLELGIDIGDVETVAQVGPGFSVASLRQRLGRSGRRAGMPAMLRLYITEEARGVAASVSDRLRLDLVQAIAIVECMLEGWCEPPRPAGLHLSTLVHQTLALVMQKGGVQPATAWRMLCGRGPFRSVDRDLYVAVLRAMADPERPLVEQSPGGLLMLGSMGEVVAAGHDFYAVFETPDEYRVIHGSRTLGTLPLDRTVAVGQTIVFAGRRWRVTDIDEGARVLLVKPSNSAIPPVFDGGFGGIHDHVAERMRLVLEGNGVPVYLDPVARQLLEEAREAYAGLGLARRRILAQDGGVILLPWVGTRRLETFLVALLARNYEAGPARHAVEVDNCTVRDVQVALAAFASGDVPSDSDLVAKVAQPAINKYDRFLGPELMGRVVLAERLEPASIAETARRLLP